MCQNLFVADVMRPAIGVEYSLIQFAMCQIQPGGTLVVEIGQGALFQSKTGLIPRGLPRRLFL